MAVVKQYISSKGASIIIADDAYRDKTPEEMQATKDNLNKVVSHCMWETAKIRAERAAKKEQTA